ncbi:hypothetical protein [Acidocella sp.]|uniref:hypothetical protein n=1 Tax=Acidocella sp. TaxID=50710 RepID=UPI00262DA03B|nr:hypothetical protein [Acidocella sp.]
MSSTSYLTVAGGGSANIHSGILSVPSALPSTINSLLQTYLDGVSAAVGGTQGFINYNAVNSAVDSAAGSGSNNFEEITNTDSVGASVSGSPAAGLVSVNPAVSDLVVQAPGSLTVSGSSVTGMAVFGASSNVTYSVNGGAGTIVAAGGVDSIYATNASDSVISGGNDTISFSAVSAGNETVDAVGNATTRVYLGGADAATVIASDSAQASVIFQQRAGGNLDFINNSSSSQTIYSGTYTVAGAHGVVQEFTANSITAFGGAGGGFFVGGSAGFNSLNGGTGNATLIGGGQGDILSTGGASNVLFVGNGAETMLGGGGANSFFLGTEDVGIGTIRAVGDLASAGGSGAQSFVLGQLAATTLTGSTVTGASNVYDVLGTYTTLGGQGVTFSGSDFTITDFGAHDTINLLNGSYKTGTGAPSVESVQAALGGGSQILLTDGTVITLKGVSASNVHVGVSGHQITLQ